MEANNKTVPSIVVYVTVPNKEAGKKLAESTGIREEYQYKERRPSKTYAETHVEIDRRHKPHDTAIDLVEREYRARVQHQPKHKETKLLYSSSTVDVPAPAKSYFSSTKESRVGTTVDATSFKPQQSYYSNPTVVDSTVDAPVSYPTYAKSSIVVDETVNVPKKRRTPSRSSTVIDEIVETRTVKKSAPKQKKSKMGYYDEEEQIDVRETIRTSSPRRPAASDEKPGAYSGATVTIPCHHIRLGDILMLQSRPCQVIRISTSAATGQHRYLGVDLFTKQLHEESSSISNPAPSVVVQTMQGPVLKQYRVLDMQDGAIVAMTETGDVKQALPVIEQSNLWSRLKNAFESGRGSLRVLVINDHGRELAVDMKVIHGSRL